MDARGSALRETLRVTPVNVSGEIIQFSGV
jgi:hypothetical protein